MNNKRKKMDILVVKSNRDTTSFGMSRPCGACVERLLRLPTYSGYRIRNVYYTTTSSSNPESTTTITKIRLNHLVNQATQHQSRFQRTNGIARVGSKWRARPVHEGKYHTIGYYPSAREAAEAVRVFLQDSKSHCNHNHTSSCSHSHDEKLESLSTDDDSLDG